MSPEILNRKKIKAKGDTVSSILLYFSFFGNFPYELNDLNDKIIKDELRK